MSIDYKVYELTNEQLSFQEAITKEFELSLGHDASDFINNNNW